MGADTPETGLVGIVRAVVAPCEAGAAIYGDRSFGGPPFDLCELRAEAEDVAGWAFEVLP